MGQLFYPFCVGTCEVDSFLLIRGFPLGSSARLSASFYPWGPITCGGISLWDHYYPLSLPFLPFPSPLGPLLPTFPFPSLSFPFLPFPFLPFPFLSFPFPSLTFHYFPFGLGMIDPDRGGGRGIERFITIVAPVRPIEEAREGSETIVMVVCFQQVQDVVLVCPLVMGQCIGDWPFDRKRP